MRKREIVFKILLFIGFIFYSGVMVAYAAMSKSLNVTFGNVTQNALTWNISYSANQFIPTTIGTSNVGLSCSEASLTKSGTLIIPDISVSKPGDECNYYIGMKNDGSITAKLSVIDSQVSPIYCNYTTNTCQQCDFSNVDPGGPYVCGKVTYLFTSTIDGTTGLPISSFVLYPSGQSHNTRYVYLRIFYNDDTVSGQSYSLSAVSFKFGFTQN